MHPLDRPIWTALTTRQSHLALEAQGVRRFDPAFAPFAASADGTPESFEDLSALVAEGGTIVLQQERAIEEPPGLSLVRAAETVQMVAERPREASARLAFEELTPADAPEMLELAQLTKPGPFSERTHELGRFVGIRDEGRLVAMAGERLKTGSFTEVSGVCTHPDHRGKGYAADLMSEIARGIVARGETPFLHAFADNVVAIALYEKLGYAIRWRPLLMVFQRCRIQAR